MTTSSPTWLPPAAPAMPDLDRRPRPNWPFLVYEQDGQMWLNEAPRTAAYDEALQVGDAPF